MRPHRHARPCPTRWSILLGLALLHGTLASAGVLLQAAPGDSLSIHSSNGFAALIPKAGTVLNYGQYDAIAPTLTLSDALQQFSAYSSYLSQRQVDFQASMNSSSGTDYSKESQTYRFTDGSCNELDLMFDSSGKLANKRTYMQLPDALTSSKLNFFDESVGSTLTLDQARQFIGSSGVQTGISYVSFNGGSDSSWRWEQSDHEASIQLNFNASGNINFLSQWQKTVNTRVDLTSVYPRLQAGMSLSEVRNLLGGNGALAAKNFPQAQQTDFVATTAYHWNDANDNRVRVEFNNNTLSWTQAAGPDFGQNSLAAALLSAGDLNKITLGSTADTVKSIFGAPNNSDPYNLTYRDSDGSNLMVWISPNYIPSQPPPGTTTNPSTPATTTTQTTVTNLTQPNTSTTTTYVPTTTTNTTTYIPTTTTNTTNYVTTTTTTLRDTIPGVTTTLITTPSTTTTAPNTTPTAPTPPTVVYKVSGAGLHLQCQAQEPYIITGTHSGTIANRSLVANITVDPADRGKAGTLYILAALPYGMGVLALTQNKGWQQITSASQIPVYATVTLGSHTITVLDGSADLSSVPGIRFFAAYLLAQQDPLKDGKGERIDTLKP